MSIKGGKDVDENKRKKNIGQVNVKMGGKKQGQNMTKYVAVTILLLK